MTSKSPFELIYASQVKGHLSAIERKYHSLIRRTVEVQLRFEPEVETRSNRKPLKRPSGLGAERELRFGLDNQFRVFYAVERENRRVFILAIGTKSGNRLVIGREEANL